MQIAPANVQLVIESKSARYSNEISYVFSGDVAMGTMGLLGADQSWTGPISDSMCGASHGSTPAKQCGLNFGSDREAFGNE
jgi:hypothetical protein